MVAAVDERTLIRYLRTRTKTGEGRRWRCPDESQIAAYVDGQVEASERERIKAHLADCNFCLDQVAFAARIVNAKLPDGASASLLSRARDLAGSRTRVALIPAWGRVAAAAAVACLAIVVTVSVRRSHLPPGPSSRPSVETPSSSAPVPASSSSAASAVRGGAENALTVVFPAADSVVQRKNLLLRWGAVSGALYYDISLMTADGNLVWEGRADGNSLKVPPNVKLEAGHKYYLMVRADLPEAKTVESKAVAFSVADQN